MTERDMTDVAEQLGDAMEELDAHGRDADQSAVADAVEICEELAEQAEADGLDDGPEHEFLLSARDTLADVRDGNDVSDEELEDATTAVKLIHLHVLQAMLESLAGEA